MVLATPAALVEEALILPLAVQALLAKATMVVTVATEAAKQTGQVVAVAVLVELERVQRAILQSIGHQEVTL